MATQAANLERTVEARISRLESHVEHIQSDITEMKANILRLDHKFDSLRDSLSEFRLATEKTFARLTLWALALYFTLAASLVGVMAKGFGWIK
jgi:predicted RNase H-like nuclease (RuvC/YqgF family)